MAKQKTFNPFEDEVNQEIAIEFVEPEKFKVEFISTLYLSQKQGYRVGTITELDKATYDIAKKYNSIKDL